MKKQTQKLTSRWMLFVLMGLMTSKAFAFQELFSGQVVEISTETASIENHLRQIQQEKNGLKALQKQLTLAQGISYLTPVIAVGFGVNSFVHEIERRVHKNGLRGILRVQKLNPRDERFQNIIGKYGKDISAEAKSRNISAGAAAAAGLTYWAVDKKWIPYIQQHIDQRIHTLEDLEKDLVEDSNLKK